MFGSRAWVLRLDKGPRFGILISGNTSMGLVQVAKTGSVSYVVLALVPSLRGLGRVRPRLDFSQG